MIHLLGIPFDANSSFLRGPAQAPSRIRQMEKDGSANCFAENGTEITNGKQYFDAGDILFSDDDPAAAFKLIKKTVSGIIKDNNKLLCLGGDHSISYPVISAYSEVYKDLNILHLDAHADLYENFENNPYSHASPFARIMETGKINSLTQIGIRTLNTHQREQAKKYKVNLIEMKDFNLSFLHHLKAPLYISLDLDVLDPAFAPGVSHHEPGGISTRELIHIIQQIPAEIAGADIVELNPARDNNNMTAMAGYKLMKELLAKM
jgi:agmatinase